ncbi:MAG: hypothetical protein LQ349_008080 [Xanthoria aureola]|nr:MAG: hypothetical protein LQ349_008080 [Xanthoria aureola]
MPPSAKRRRLFDTSDPDAELHERRVRNDKKLKARFESIFEKYSKNFSGIGDIIDFNQDKIVVDNGHLWDMQDEKDPGQKHPSQLKDDNASSRKSSNTLRPEPVIPDSQEYESDDNDPLGILEDAQATNIQRVRKSVESSFLGCSNDRCVEPAWRAPLLPADVNMRKALPSPSPSLEDDSHSSRSASPEGVSIWALPKRKRDVNTSGSLPSRTTPNTSSKPSVQSRWTPEERQLLCQLKLAGSAWIEIEKQFPSRTLGAIQVFWHSFQKKCNKSPTQSGSVPSHGPPLQSLGDADNENDVLTNQSDRPLQARELDTPAPSILARTPDIELEDGPAKPNGSPPHPPKETGFRSDTIIPDSQDSLDTLQVLEQSPEPQIDALTSNPGLDNRRKDSLQSEVSSTGIVAGPPLPGLSSHTSPNTSNLHPTVFIGDKNIQSLQTIHDKLQADRPAHPPFSTLTESHCMQNDDLLRSKKWKPNMSSKDSSNESARSKEHLMKDMDGTSCSGNEPSAPLAPLDDSVGRFRTHIKTITSRELWNLNVDVANPTLVQAAGGESGNEQLVHGMGGKPEATSLPPEAPDLLPNLSADASQPATEAVSTRLFFAWVEIPPRSNMVPVKPVVSEGMPEECFDGRVIDQHVRYAGHVTPPRGLLPAQEESLRKIKPFSLILPTDGSPTNHEHLRWKSPYLQSLDQKYRLGQGEGPLGTASPRIEEIQAIGSNRVAPLTNSPPDEGIEDLWFSGNDILADHGTPPQSAILQRRISNAEDDEDDLAIALNFQNQKRQSHSARKHQLAFRPRIGGEDISDDELSTPLKTIGDRVEMTPVRACRA